MKILYILCLCIWQVSFLWAQTPKTAKGSLTHIENFPSQFVAPRHVDIWLPDGYTPRQKYAVLYMQDGQMLFDSTITWNKQAWGADETVSALMEAQKIKNTIIVGIWNGGKSRHAEYFPQKPFESLTPYQKDTLFRAFRNKDTKLFNDTIQSDKYLKFVVTELKPYIDKHFSTHKDRKNTFIAGSSMGGLISMYAVCEYPKIFGGAACLSTHWVGVFRTENNPIPDAFMAYMQKHLPAPKTHKIYFDYGTTTLDALYPPFQKRVDKIMQDKGFSAKNWLTKEFVGEDHSERAWRKRLAIPLEFLLRNE